METVIGKKIRIINPFHSEEGHKDTRDYDGQIATVLRYNLALDFV